MTTSEAGVQLAGANGTGNKHQQQNNCYFNDTLTRAWPPEKALATGVTTHRNDKNSNNHLYHQQKQQQQEAAMQTITKVTIPTSPLSSTASPKRIALKAHIGLRMPHTTNIFTT